MVRVARQSLLGFLALATSLGAGAASAQSYFLDYTGAQGSATISLMATISGLNCNPSCTLTSASQLTGTMTLTGTTGALTPGTYGITFNPSGHVGGPDDVFNLATGLDHGGIDFSATIPPNGSTTFNLFGNGASGSNGSESNVDIFTGGGNNFTPTGTLTYGQEAAASPAPVVGAGPWSWLALGVIGLFCRRTLAVRARALFAKLASSGA